MVNNFCCIECGYKTEHLYRHYSSTVLKLNVCDNCKNIVDRYIEYDNCIVFMDAFLLKIPAIRHIIFNSEFKAFWKLGLLCLICDAYIKWEETRTQLQRAQEFHLEWAFYFTCLCSLLDTCAFAMTVSTFSRLTNRQLKICDLINAILFAKFGQLLIIPTVIWDLCKSQFYMWIRVLFIFISNIQAHRAVCLTGKTTATIGILIGCIIQSIVSYYSFKFIL